MRINQFIAAATGLSRRAADAAIQAGRVKLDGQIATLGQAIEDASEILLDDTPLHLAHAHTYIMLNKPAGYVSSRVQQSDDPTLYDLLLPEHRSLRIVGRLDRDSSGLVLLTDDGDFIQTHTHPSYEKTKLYQLTLQRPLAQPDQERLKAGVILKDGLSRPELLQVKGRSVTVSLSEGRNRQLRRTFGALGYTVERLHRTQMGPYHLGDLTPGKWRKVLKE